MEHVDLLIVVMLLNHSEAQPKSFRRKIVLVKCMLYELSCTIILIRKINHSRDGSGCYKKKKTADIVN